MPARVPAVAQLVGDAFPGSWFEEAWAGYALPLSSRSPREPPLCHSLFLEQGRHCGPWVKTWGVGARRGVLFSGLAAHVWWVEEQSGAETLSGRWACPLACPWPLH